MIGIGFWHDVVVDTVVLRSSSFVGNSNYFVRHHLNNYFNNRSHI